MSPRQTHVVYYLSNLSGNGDPEHGIARVTSETRRPGWADCRAQIPGFVTGEYLGLAPDSKERRS